MYIDHSEWIGYILSGYWKSFFKVWITLFWSKKKALQNVEIVRTIQEKKKGGITFSVLIVGPWIEGKGDHTSVFWSLSYYLAKEWDIAKLL